MSFSTAFLDDLRSSMPLSQLVTPHVTWDMRKSNPIRGDWWAPCPFHQEKSASFHIDDQKGFFYCFGCHAKGDIFRFVQDHEKRPFMEAVEVVAALAGVALPHRTPSAAGLSEKRTILRTILEAAAKWYELKLASPAGEAARTYLERREISSNATSRWNLGFAPKAPDALVKALLAQGFACNDLIACGLAIAHDGKTAVDRFRNRLMIPIRDTQGHIVSFGGRALDPKTSAKYINGPTTALFDKSRTLFNYSSARAAGAKDQQLVVVEGYLDVISMVEAGITATVAPLGTAVTEQQIKLLLSISDEPVFALDGDAAGLRAAFRTIDTALPLVNAGKGIRFCILPTGQDPDDMIRAGDADKLRTLISQSSPMVDLLWQRETKSRVLDSPERIAAVEKRLIDATNRITDASIKDNYVSEFRDRMRRLKKPTHTNYLRGTATQAIFHSRHPVPRHMAEVTLLLWLADQPTLVRHFAPALERLRTSTPTAHALRDLLLLKNTLGQLNRDDEIELQGILSALNNDSDLASRGPDKQASNTEKSFFAAATLFRLQAPSIR